MLLLLFFISSLSFSLTMNLFVYVTVLSVLFADENLQFSQLG